MFENLMTETALPEALRISGVGLLAIFFVMGLFGSLIALLARLFPDGRDKLADKQTE